MPQPDEQPPEVASDEQMQALAAELGVDLQAVRARTAGNAARSLGKPAENAEQVFRLWPEHLPAARLFDGCCTQWRHAGMDGTPTGLDYAGVRASGAFHALPEHQRQAAMEDLHFIEVGWLAEYRRRRATQRPQPRPEPPEPD